MFIFIFVALIFTGTAEYTFAGDTGKEHFKCIQINCYPADPQA